MCCEFSDLKKLARLKQQILESGYPTHTYTNPSMMQEKLETDLERYIEEHYPKGSELSPLESERFRQVIFHLLETNSLERFLQGSDSGLSRK